jgi:hypothetical protein
MDNSKHEIVPNLDKMPDWFREAFEDSQLFTVALSKVAELEAKLERLTSRGFEDLHDENETMKETIKRVREWKHDFCFIMADNPNASKKLDMILDKALEDKK